MDSPEVTRNATSASIQWLSQDDRTYFLQHSTDMLNWSFLPTISSGNGSLLSTEFHNSPPELFIRLNWTDIPDDGDPNTADFDSDGLESLEELLASPQTSPLLFDTDGDLLSDGQERALHLNATLADTDGNGTIDSSEDFDGDGLSTLFELTSAIPTNPFAVDSDNDGLNDDVEILLGLNPLLNDTNGDGTLDSEEDSDADGVNNLIEQNSGSDPSNNSDLGTPPSEGLNEVRYEIQAARISTDARHLQISSVDRNRFPFNLPFSYGASSRVHFIPTQYIAAPATIPFLESLALSTLESESNHWQFLRDDQIIVSGGFHTSNPRSVPLTPFNGIRRSQSINSGYGIAKFRLSRTRPEDTPLQQQFIEISEESPGFTTIEGERQDVTSEAKTFTLTIPAGGTKSTPYTVQAPLKNEVETRVDIFPVELWNIKGEGDTDDVMITPWNTSENITNNNIAWIDAHQSPQNSAPRMPQLEFKIPWLREELTLEAKISVQYSRGNGSRAARNQPQDRVRIPANGIFAQVNGDTWQIYNEAAWQNELTNHGFFGGEATIIYQIKRGRDVIAGPLEFDFRIGGENPNDLRCRTYIESLPDAGPTGNLWFAYAIAKSETRGYGGGSFYNQFPDNGGAYSGPNPQGIALPAWGNDGGTLPGGYGIYQVTGNVNNAEANIPRKEIWNWQENIISGLVIISDKRNNPNDQVGAAAWMNRQKNTTNANGIALPNHTVRGVTFTESGIRNMIGAVTIKAYNGASRAPTGFIDNGNAPGFRLDPQGAGHYCFWRNSTNQWALSRFNGFRNPFNYVDRVCNEVED